MLTALDFAAFVAAAAGIFLAGRPLTALAWRRLSSAERLVFNFVFGAFIVCSAVAVLGFAGVFNRYVGFGVLAGSWAFVFYRPSSLASELKDVARSIRRFFGALTGFEVKVAVGLLFFLGLVYFALAFGPETRVDALAYHLELPKRYLAEGRINFQYDLNQASYPALWDMVYGYGLMLTDESVSRLFAFSASVLLVVAVYAVGRRLFGRTAGVLAAAVLAVTPSYAVYWSSAMTDIAFGLFIFIGLYSIVLTRDRPVRGAVMSGLCIGFAAASRMQFFVLTPVILVLILGVYFQVRARAADIARGLAIITSITAVAAVPWYINNYVATGNFLGYEGLALERIEYWRKGVSSGSFLESVVVYLTAGLYRGPAGPWYRVLLTPVYLTFFTDSVVHLGVGPLFLAVIPGLFFVKKRKKWIYPILFIVVMVLLSFIVLLKGVTYRYVTWGLPFAVLLSAFVWREFASAGNLGRVFSAFLLLVVVVLSGYYFISQVEYFPVILGLRDRDDLINEKSFDGFDALGEMRNLPPESLILSTEYKTYYFERRTVNGLPHHNFYFNTARLKNPEEMLGWMRSHGITHVFSTRNAASFKFPGNPKDKRGPGYNFYEDFLLKYTKNVTRDREGGTKPPYYGIYEIIYTENCRG